MVRGVCRMVRRPRVDGVQKCGKLFAEGFIPLGMMAGDNRLLEQALLYGLGQLPPCLDDGLAKSQSKTIFHPCSMRGSATCSSSLA